MILTPAPPRPPGPPGPARRLPGPDPAAAAPGVGAADPQPRLPGTAGEPDDIITWYVRPRRRRRRRLAVAAAVLAAATVWVDLVIWPGSPTMPRPPGGVYAPHPKAVIHLARARQHRRRQHIAQAVADTITAVGGGAADGLHSRWWPGTRRPRPHDPKLPGPGPAGLTGINVLGWGCFASGAARIASDGRHVWVICSDESMLELDAATGALVRMRNAPSHLFINWPDAVATDGRHVWEANFGGGSVTELDAVTGVPVRVLNGHRYRFNWPYAIATDGRHVWVGVANFGGGSVTELDAVTGVPVRVLNGHRYRFNWPYAIATDGRHVWVANLRGGSVTELDAATGSAVRVLRGRRYGFGNPSAVAVDGRHVWVTNDPDGGDSVTELDSDPDGGGSVTELDAATGALVRVLKGRGYGFSNPSAVAVDGRHVWVTNDMNSDGGSVTELDAATGAPVVNGSAYGFGSPSAVAVDGARVWVTNFGGNSVTELDAVTGAVVRVLGGRGYGFGSPSAVASDGRYVLVTNDGTNDPDSSPGGSVTELDAATGAPVRVLNGPRYEFNRPGAVAADGARVWVANSAGDSVTEFPASH